MTGLEQMGCLTRIHTHVHFGAINTHRAAGATTTNRLCCILRIWLKTFHLYTCVCLWVPPKLGLRRFSPPPQIHQIISARCFVCACVRVRVYVCGCVCGGRLCTLAVTTTVTRVVVVLLVVVVCVLSLLSPASVWPLLYNRLDGPYARTAFSYSHKTSGRPACGQRHAPHISHAILAYTGAAGT